MKSGIDGPAVERSDGHKEYYLKGEQLEESKFYLYQKLMKNIVNNNEAKQKNKL